MYRRRIISAPIEGETAAGQQPGAASFPAKQEGGLEGGHEVGEEREREVLERWSQVRG